MPARILFLLPDISAFLVQFLEAYQELLLAEPESAVSQPLKEAFLALRQAAESSD